ncbi:mitochondrial import inner membrane translocase subunit TIM22 [Exidia glandulosa HHB12029]|uniref:Mitochondrial import inner membrane translocase subunit TIM22 n=1 Tax=Exidia glandulosa HHB12029 TaxID=1314781 RepID=A0A165DIR9_EXIGL|nr:mitochondrial import inner membrane translocase subunit TIM22 [Exidia glandulosa HHB12029]
MSFPHLPGAVPLYPPGKEPLPAWVPEDSRDAFLQQQKFEKIAAFAQETCVFKSVLSGAMGFGLGAFFSLMSASFAYEDPILRAHREQGMNTVQKTSTLFKEMGQGMWRQGKSFGRIGGMYTMVECIIEGYRAKNDMVNPVAAGFVTGAILARASGPRAALGGGAAFAAFSGAVDLFMRRETPDDD